MIDTLCLSGGGLLGISFIGVLDFLENNKNINLTLITNYVGTSIGALLSFLFSINYSIKEIKEFIINFNFGILTNSTENNIENLLINCGIDDGNKIIYILQSFLKNKYNIVDITFEKHYELTNKKLNIVGTNYTKSSEELFNHERTPLMSIITAVRISISIPLIFTPILYNDNYYLDGALVNNFPINYCNIKNTIGINIILTKNTDKIDDMFIFIKNCIGITINNKYLIKSLNIIEIKDTDIMNNLINFNINNEQKESLLKLGNTIGEKYINELSLNICNSIIDDIISIIINK